MTKKAERFTSSILAGLFFGLATHTFNLGPFDTELRVLLLALAFASGAYAIELAVENGTRGSRARDELAERRRRPRDRAA